MVPVREWVNDQVSRSSGHTDDVDASASDCSHAWSVSFERPPPWKTSSAHSGGEFPTRLSEDDYGTYKATSASQLRWLGRHIGPRRERRSRRAMDALALCPYACFVRGSEARVGLSVLMTQVLLDEFPAKV